MSPAKWSASLRAFTQISILNDLALPLNVRIDIIEDIISFFKENI